MKPSVKTRHLLSGLLLLAAGITEAQAGVVVTNPTSLSAGDTYRLVFVTSTTRDATSSNIADYNSFVTAVANSNAALLGLGTTWTAVASTVAVSALANTGTDWMPAGIQGVPIFRLDNTLLATDYDQFWNATGNHLAAFNITENADVYTGPSALTGTSGQGGEMGLPAYGGTGGVALGKPTILNGHYGVTNALWVDGNFQSASTLGSVYAISGVLTATPEPSSALLLAGSGIMLALRRRRAASL